MNLLLPTTITCLLVTGMGLALLGSVKLALARKLKIDEAQVGGLVSLFGFTMIPVILTVGFLTDLMGRQVILIGGTVLMSVALLVLAGSRGYGAALFSVLLLSAAWSAQINVINVLVPHVLLPPTFLATDIPEISFATNLGNVFFGLGAFLTPLAIAWTLRRLGLSSGRAIRGSQPAPWWLVSFKKSAYTATVVSFGGFRPDLDVVDFQP